MSQLKLLSTINMALLAVFVSLHVIYVDSFSSYLPDSGEALAAGDDVEGYDLRKQPSLSADDKLLYRLLTQVYLANFNKASRQRQLDAQLSSEGDVPRTPYFKPTSGLGDIVKRKVFWQPLGYLPSGKKPVIGDTGSSGGSSRVNIIRYG